MTSSASGLGTVLDGKYRLEQVIGEGSMGLVVQARHVTNGSYVALKILVDAESTDALARFEREARVASTLRGDKVARVLDVGQTPDGRPYIAMELLRGRDLRREIVMRAPIPIEEAVDYVLQACEGVAEAHAAGLVHRDLKPANLFLVGENAPNRVVKVLDFGLSKLRSHGGGNPRLTKTGSWLGTIEYTSPEQLRSAKHVDARADQYSLGVILFELLTGKRPFARQRYFAHVIAVSTQVPPRARSLRPELPPALDEAIHRALSRKPKNRFRDLAAFSRALAPFGMRAGWKSAAAVQELLSDAAPSSSVELLPSSSDEDSEFTETETRQLDRPYRIGETTVTREKPKLPATVGRTASGSVDVAARGKARSDPPMKRPRRLVFAFGALIALVFVGVAAFVGHRLIAKRATPAEPSPPASETEVTSTPPPSAASPAPTDTAPSASAAASTTPSSSAGSGRPPGAGSRAPNGKANPGRTPGGHDLRQIDPADDIFGHPR